MNAMLDRTMRIELTGEFRAMNTDVSVILAVPHSEAHPAEQALKDVERRFGAIEDCLSRFRPESELNRLNSAGGRPFAASPTLMAVITAARDAAEETDGMFDPTILGALESAGYDRSFELLDLPARDPDRGDAAATWSWRDINVHQERQEVTLPVGCRIDLGGIGKGWAVDRSAQQLATFDRFVIDAGGDMLVRGCQADGSAWTVGVQDPTALERDLMVLTVADRAVATSSTARRRWQRAGRSYHHLIDPRTGQPSDTDVLAATVVADSVARAEVFAKVAVMLSSAEAVEFIERQAAVQAILVLKDGQIRLCGASLVEVHHAG